MGGARRCRSSSQQVLGPCENGKGQRGHTWPAGASLAACAARQGELLEELVGGGHQGANTVSHTLTSEVRGRDSGQLRSARCSSLNRRLDRACKRAAGHSVDEMLSQQEGLVPTHTLQSQEP